jgi:cardiolipin synthase
VTAIILINCSSPAEYRCAWLALIAALPLIGSIVYFAATNRKQPTYSSLPSSASFERAVYLKDGAQYFSLLFEEIKRAKKFVYLEYYIFKEGAILNQLLTLIEGAAGRGVKVCIIMDGLGSFKLKRKTLKRLKSCGVKVKVFHRLSPSISQINNRDHRKIAAIDGKVAFIGGINIADEYANLSSPHGYWKDTGVAFYGDGAKVFANAFMCAFDKNYVSKDIEQNKNNLAANNALLPIFDGICEDILVALISRAEREICILTPYLCVGEKLKDALIFAAKRGVDVKIIIPSVPDKKLTFELTKSYAHTLIEGGIQVYSYTPGFMHAKCFIADGVALIGSFNLDFRSMHLNSECGALFCGDIAKAALSDFNQCLALSRRLNAKNAGPIYRVYISLLKLFAPLV